MQVIKDILSNDIVYVVLIIVVSILLFWAWPNALATMKDMEIHPELYRKDNHRNKDHK